MIFNRKSKNIMHYKLFKARSCYFLNKFTFFLLFFGFFVPRGNFTLIWRPPVADKGQQILSHARNSWPLSREGSLTCHTYCDTGQPFIMVIDEDPWHSHLVLSVWLPFNDFGLFRPGIEPRSVVFEANALPLSHRSGQSDSPLSFNFIHFVQYCLSH